MKQPGFVVGACVCILSFSVGVAGEAAGRSVAQGQRIDWNAKTPWGVLPAVPLDQQRKEPAKIFDNVYAVGIQTASPFLITTSAGLVLLDATWAETAGLVLDSIRKAGFDPANIKYVLITHAHLDHFGGAGVIKQAAPAARVGMSAEDWQFAEAQIKSGAPQGNFRPAPLTRDLVLKDGETLTLGDTTFKFYVTPGHTPGATSIEYQVKDRGMSYRALSPGGVGIAGGPEWTPVFIKSHERLKQLGPWDVLLPNHPGMMLPRPLADIEKELPKRGQGAHPAVVGGAQISAWFDAVLKVAREKLAYEQKGN